MDLETEQRTLYSCIVSFLFVCIVTETKTNNFYIKSNALFLQE